MKGNRIFIDTNILVYAYDIDAGEKHTIAKNNIYDLWNSENLPYVSIQVLQEMYVTLIRKDVTLKEARGTIEELLNWNVINNDASLLIEGIRQKERWKISYWDALILAAAKHAKAQVLWSEDFNHKQNYGGIIAINPLIV